MSWLNMVPDWVFGEKKNSSAPQQFPMSGAPIGRPMGYTGNGGDGKIQTSMPTSMVQTTRGPLILHEGEGTMQNKDGSVTVVPQKDLLNMQKGMGIPGMETGGTFTPASNAIGAPKINANDNFLNTGLSELQKQATGQSTIFKSQENIANQNLGGASLAAIGAAKQQGAQSGLDKQGIGQVAQQASRALEGERSVLQGQIAQNKQQMASSAAGNLTSMAIGAKSQALQEKSQAESQALQERGMGLQEKSYADTKSQSDWERMLQYYDPASESGLRALQSAYVEKFGGTAPDMNTLIEQRKYTQQKQQQDLASGKNTLTAQEISNVAAQLGVNTSQSQAIIDAINSGATKDFIAQRYGITVSDEQYNSIKELYAQKVASGARSITAQDISNAAAQLNIDTTKAQNVITAINSGATKDYISQAFGVNLTDEQYNSMQVKYSQSIKAGTISLTSGELQNQATSLGIDAQKMQNAITAINAGGSKQYVESLIGKSLTDAEFNSMRQKYLQEIKMGDLTITSQDLANVSSQLGIDVNRSQAVIDAVNNGATLDYVNKTYGTNITPEQFNGLQKKYYQSITAGDMELESLKNKVGDEKFASTVNRITAGASLDTINSTLGINMTRDEYAQMFEASETYFKKQGLTMEQASLYGYKDESGNQVPGSLQNAATQLGLQAKELDNQTKELFGYTDAAGNYKKGRYDLLSEENKRAADQLYGYDVRDANGNIVGRVSGSLELQNIATDIQKQGLSLEEAQIKGYIDPKTGQYVKGSVALANEKQGLEVSSLYGYSYDPATGQIVTDPQQIVSRSDLVKVDGSLALAQKQFGLQSSTFDLQKMELMGGRNSQGQYVPGKLELMSNEDKRAAQQMYGYDETLSDGTTVHRAGTMEIAKDEIEIKKQGLDLESAKIYGYYNKAGGYVPGTMDIESQKLDLLRDEYDSQKSSATGESLAAHFSTMANTPNYNWENDAQAKKLLQTYWEQTTGSTEPFDQEWADRQFNASTVTSIDAAITKLEGSDWYQNLGADEKKRMKQTVEYAAMLSVTQGISPVYDETGAVTKLVDSEGDTVWNLKPTTSTQPVVNTPTQYQDLKPGETYVTNGLTYKIDTAGKSVLQSTPQEKVKSYENVTSSINPDIAGKISQAAWESLGMPDAATLEDWYNNKGGKNYLAVNNLMENWDSSVGNLQKLATEYQKVSPNSMGQYASSIQENQAAVLRSQIATALGGDVAKPEELMQSLTWLQGIAGEDFMKDGLNSNYLNENLYDVNQQVYQGDRLLSKDEVIQLNESWKKRLSDPNDSYRTSLLKNMGYSDSEISEIGTKHISQIAGKSFTEKLSKQGYNEDQILKLWKLATDGNLRNLIRNKDTLFRG